MSPNIPIALTVAGSDSGGGAGLQVDLKVFSSLGVFGSTVVTAITVQNSQEVREVKQLPASLVEAQLRAVLDDFSPGAIKTGMLWTAANVEKVAAVLSALKRRPPLVVDPVIWAGDGSRLLSENGVAALRKYLFPLAAVITPNLDEAAHLSGARVRDIQDARLAAERLLTSGAQSVLVKGGHLSGLPVDIFYDGNQFSELRAAKKAQGVTHGTGCALSAAIASFLAKGLPLHDAIEEAHGYTQKLIHGAQKLGKGSRLLIPFLGGRE